MFLSLNSSWFFLKKQTNNQISRLFNICLVPSESALYGEWSMVAVHLVLNEWLLFSIQQLRIKE